MTGYERISNILKRKPVDRIGLYEHFWSDTHRDWSKKGHIKEGETLVSHFNYDMDESWAFNLTADLDFKPVVVEETRETILTRDGNGALLRRHKIHDATPEHVDFLVKDRRGWEEHIKPILKAEEKRIDFEGYRRTRERAKNEGRFFLWSGVNVFESIHPVCGHEHMLVGMALDPDWVRDMVNTYSELTVNLQEILFEREGYPDGIWYYEDMGFKQKPFFSPAMYREIILPGHKRTFDYAHGKNLPVIVHSCGFVEPLVADLVKIGMDCLQVIEVKAGMDLLKLYRDFSPVLSFMGGIDIRTLYTNNREIIREELTSKIPHVMGNFGYVLHSDHSIPVTVEYETYRYFIETGLELGTY